MGEYAIRKSDGEETKIGTCRYMYYLRFEDREKVIPLPGNVNPAKETNLYFRLPFPDEDELLPGSYNDYDRSVSLLGEFSPNNTEPGIIELHPHECGLLINLPCYHGSKLPKEEGEGVKAFWNGKSNFWELSSLKSIGDDKVRAVVRCKYCDTAYIYDWEDIFEYIPEEMQKRLEQYK